MSKKLQIDFYESSTRPRVNKGNKIPPWLDTETDLSTWYDDAGKNFFFNIVDNKIYVQYGLNEAGWAGVRFLSQTLDIIDETLNSDNSITFNLEVRANFFIGRIAPVSQEGWQVETEVTIDNKHQYEYIGNTRANYKFGSRPIIRTQATVQPEETYTGSALKIYSYYPNGESPINTLIVGFGLYNPNPPAYVPMAIRKSNNWKDLNTNNGVIEIRHSNNWIDKSEENMNTSRAVNEGQNRMRISNKWRQLPVMVNGKAPK